MIKGCVTAEEWPLREVFTISRSSRTAVETVHLSITDGHYVGQGECQPNSRYGETVQAVTTALASCFPGTFDGLRQKCSLLDSMAARNALDCALLDLHAKREGRRIWNVLGLSEPTPVASVFTLSVASPDMMAKNAARAFKAGRTRLKLKLAGEGDMDRLLAVRKAVPDATLIVDANEAWTPTMLVNWMPILAAEGIALLEQPLPVGQDSVLAGVERLLPICADESCHTAADVPNLLGKYDCINIKLDKTGGLTPALALLAEARKHELAVMVGCMLGTSLAMAPALLVASIADFADLDGPLLLQADREFPLFYDGGLSVYPPSEALWG